MYFNGECVKADGGWRRRGECASVMTRQTERMVLAAAAAHLIFSPFLQPEPTAPMTPRNETSSPLRFGSAGTVLGVWRPPPGP